MKNRKIKTERIYKTINKKSNKNREKNSNELNGAKIKNLFNITKVENKEKGNINTKKINFIIIVFMIIILFLAGCSIGKSITDIILVSEIEVAKPILEVKSNPEIDVTASNNIGEYEFRVLNYNEKELSEVNLKYFIEIKADVDESIQFYLYKNGQEIKLNNLCTDYMLLEKGEKREEKYLLKVIYTKKGSQNMEDILQKIQIKIHSEQQKV